MPSLRCTGFSKKSFVRICCKKLTKMNILTFIVWGTASLSMSIGATEDELFQKEVESTLRDASKSDEGLADPGGLARLKRAMARGGDWDGALVRLIDRDKYDDELIDNAISALRVRGTFGRPEVQAAVISYFKSRVKAARAHDRAEPLFDAVVRTGIGGLSSTFAKIDASGSVLTIDTAALCADSPNMSLFFATILTGHEGLGLWIVQN